MIVSLSLLGATAATTTITASQVASIIMSAGTVLCSTAKVKKSIKNIVRKS